LPQDLDNRPLRLLDRRLDGLVILIRDRNPGIAAAAETLATARMQLDGETVGVLQRFREEWSPRTQGTLKREIEEDADTAAKTHAARDDAPATGEAKAAVFREAQKAARLKQVIDDAAEMGDKAKKIIGGAEAIGELLRIASRWLY
ncbi:MAG: hypothetical protein ACFBRM_05760, partial [Pikeienuella sp.]